MSNPTVRPHHTESSNTIWKRLGEFGVVAFGAYFATRTLSRLSGTALWVPADLHDTIDVLTSALGGAAFVMVHYILDVWNPAKASNHKKKRKDALTLIASVIAILLSIVTLGGFMWLRAHCVVDFDPRDWIAKQRMQNSLDANDDTKKLATTGATKLPMVETGTTTKDVPDPDKMFHRPEFVDIDRQIVYLPLRFPQEVQTYLDRVGEANGMNGLTYELSQEPDHLFDMIEKQSSSQVAETNWMFLGLEVLIILLFAIGLACSYDVASAVGTTIAGG